MNTRRDKPNATDGLLQALQAIIENVDSGQVEMYWSGSGADRAANLDAARAAVALALEERRSTWRKPVNRLPHRAGNLVKNETDPAGYRFRKRVENAWVKIENIHVHLLRTDEGVAVELYPETVTDQPIASIYGLFADMAGDPDI